LTGVCFVWGVFGASEPLIPWLRIGLGTGVILLLIAGGLALRATPHLPSETHIAWQFEVFEWFAKHFPTYGVPASGMILTPTHEDFPVEEIPPSLLGKTLFKLVKTYALMRDHPCRLTKVDDDAPPLDTPAAVPVSRAGVAGTYSHNPFDVPEITYKADLEQRPTALIAVFAHELSHLLMHTIGRLPPGGHAREEEATDMCAIYLGFGIMMANHAHEVHTSVDRWQVRRQGYLDQNQLGFALAILVLALEAPPDAIAKHLTLNPRVYFHQAISHIREHHGEELARVRAHLNPQIARTSTRPVFN